MRPFFFLAACVLAPSLAAHADTFKLTYTGSNFTTVVNAAGSTNPYTTSDRVTGSFTIVTSGPLQANQRAVASTVTDYSLSDGVQTLDPTNSFFQFSFDTDSNAGIGRYLFEADKNNTLTEDIIHVENSVRPVATGEIDVYNYASTRSLGTLTIVTSVTPEPSSLALLGTGVVGIAGVLRRGMA